MPFIYEFTPSSLQSFQRCIDVSYANHTTNQWNERFSIKDLLDGYEDIINIPKFKQETNPTVEETVNTLPVQSDIINKSETKITTEYKELETNPLMHLNYIIDESITDDSMLINLANNLSDENVQKMYQCVFEGSLDVTFEDKFVHVFLPAYFKRTNTSLSVEILSKLFKKDKSQLNNLLERIIIDSEINTIILQEFITTLNKDDQRQLLRMLMDSDMSPDMFVRNIFSIYTLYKNNCLDNKIEHFISTYLVECSEKCIDDKQYGRLLLAYLQNKTDNLNIPILEKCVEIHRSPFKRPCINALKEVVNKYN